MRAALHVFAGMPDRVDGFSVAMGPACQAGFSRAEKLDVRADARRVAAARSVSQARALWRHRTRTCERDRGAGPQGMAVGREVSARVGVYKSHARGIPAGRL